MKVWIKNKQGRHVLFGHMPASVIDTRYLYNTGKVRVALHGPLEAPVTGLAAAPTDVAHVCTLAEYPDRHNRDRCMDVVVVDGARELMNWYRCSTYPEGREVANG